MDYHQGYMFCWALSQMVKARGCGRESGRAGSFSMHTGALIEDLENSVTTLLLFCCEMAFHCPEYDISFEFIKVTTSLIFRAAEQLGIN